MVCFLIGLVLAACYDPAPETPRRKQQRVYMQVSPVARERSAWVLERVHGNHFLGGAHVRIVSAPGEFLGPHRLGALPRIGNQFTLWPGIAVPRSPVATSREIAIPVAGGPWRGIVVEMHPGVRYSTARFFPVPGQGPGPRPIATQMWYCHIPSAKSCIPWTEAVERGYAWCETGRGRRLPASECRWFVPDVHWRIVGSPSNPW